MDSIINKMINDNRFNDYQTLIKYIEYTLMLSLYGIDNNNLDEEDYIPDIIIDNEEYPVYLIYSNDHVKTYAKYYLSLYKFISKPKEKYKKMLMKYHNRIEMLGGGTKGKKGSKKGSKKLNYKSNRVIKARMIEALKLTIDFIATNLDIILGVAKYMIPIMFKNHPSVIQYNFNRVVKRKVTKFPFLNKIKINDIRKPAPTMNRGHTDVTIEINIEKAFKDLLTIITKKNITLIIKASLIMFPVLYANQNNQDKLFNNFREAVTDLSRDPQYQKSAMIIVGKLFAGAASALLSGAIPLGNISFP